EYHFHLVVGLADLNDFRRSFLCHQASSHKHKSRYACPEGRTVRFVYRQKNEAAYQNDPENKRTDAARVIWDYFLGAGKIAVDQKRAHVDTKTRYKAYRVHVGQNLLRAAGNDDNRRKEERIEQVNPIE